MALLRRGSSRISPENFNCRLEREQAKSGAITASLAWNDPSDLDLHAVVKLADGGSATISYRTKKAAGGELDVDMHCRDNELSDEPVENIFWKKPPAGEYKILVNLYKKRGPASEIKFRALLKREDEEDLSVEGMVTAAKKTLQVFAFTVDSDGAVTIVRAKALPSETPMKATRAMAVAPKAKAKAKAKGKAKALMKKPSKLLVFKGEKLKTKKGLKKEDLVKNKKGRIVSARKSANAKNSKWIVATAKARAAKGYSGFKAIKRGSSFHDKATEILRAL